MKKAQKATNLTVKHPSFAGNIGVARRDITPPLGIYARNWGSAHHDTAEGVHRPLSVTVITFASDDDQPFVLASLDLGWWRSPDEEWAFRGELLRELSLDHSRLVIHLTHTHAGPSISICSTEKPGGDKVRPYIETTRAALREAVEEALATSCRAVLDWHTGRCSLACHRDQPSPNGAGTIVGYVPEKRVDNTVLVGRVTDDSGVTLATLVNYACHPTTLAWANRLISPDYIGAMREVVEHATNGAPCLFLQGASGELAPRRQYAGKTEVADQNGRQLGYAVLATLADMLPPRQALQFIGIEESTTRLGRWDLVDCVPDTKATSNLLEIDLPLRLTQKPADTVNTVDGQDRATIERMERMANRWNGIGECDGGKLSIWMWRLGDAIMIGVPAEMHSPFQVELRRLFGEQAVVVLNLANGSLGYLPPLDDFVKQTYQCDITLFQAGAYERTMGFCVEMIGGMIADSDVDSTIGSPHFASGAQRGTNAINAG
jgi:hypothetical protein